MMLKPLLNFCGKLVKYVLVIVGFVLLTFYLMVLSMKGKKYYLGFFYGSKQELTKAFTKITKGDYVRYILTAETLICRFPSDKTMTEIIKILREHCPDIPFFIFPISSKNWRYNLPMDVENNLLTDNPIIQTPQNKIINQYFMSMLEDVKKQQAHIVDEQSPDFFDAAIGHLKSKLKQAITDDNFELAVQIRDKIKELDQQKTQLNDEPNTPTT